MLKSFVSVGTFGDRFTSMKVIRVENFHLKPIIITCLTPTTRKKTKKEKKGKYS